MGLFQASLRQNDSFSGTRKLWKMPRAAAKSAGRVKGRAPKAHKLPEQFPPGELLIQTQLAKKRWELGDIIGQGGFGLIYKASDVTEGPASPEPPFVIKIEPLDNGPLFCEFHFYQRAARPEYIAEWTKVKKLRYLGVPQFHGSGQHKKGDKQYRFLVLQRLSSDLQKVFVQNGRSFSEKTTFSIGLRMLDALEYIHDKGYCHADIKAANILLGYSSGRADFNQVFLVDYGLAYRFLVDGAHKPYKEDPKRAHDGTAEYASRDAHKGVYPSRRGDLEILGYCMLEWLAGSLPWDRNLDNKDKVRDLKIQYMSDLPGLYKTSFGSSPCPEPLKKYFNVVSKLAYDEKPDYNQLRQFLRSGVSNEWNLGLSVGASPAKGAKRKSETGGGSPPKKVRPSSSPAPTRPAKGAGRGTGSKSKTAIMNGTGTSTPTRPGGRGRPGTPGSARKTPVGGQRAPKAKAGSAIVSPSTSTGSGSKKKTRRTKSSVSSPSKGRVSSALKGAARTQQKAAPVKRKRNKKVTSSDTAVQTSPGLALRASKQ